MSLKTVSLTVKLWLVEFTGCENGSECFKGEPRLPPIYQAGKRISSELTEMRVMFYGDCSCDFDYYGGLCDFALFTTSFFKFTIFVLKQEVKEERNECCERYREKRWA